MTTTNQQQWFYEDNGQRKGPVSQEQIIDLIQSKAVAPGTAVWKQGFPDWLAVENTELNIHLDHSAPPPLSGEKINNTLVWTLAFAPLIGYTLEWILATVVSGGNELRAALMMKADKFWFITLGLNIGLAFWDEKKLKAAGHDTAKFKGWVWLVPVYLYQRSKFTKQNLAYFITWIACFVVVLLD